MPKLSLRGKLNSSVSIQPAKHSQKEPKEGFSERFEITLPLPPKSVFSVIGLNYGIGRLINIVPK